jgi:preprotein translocase subunit SecB
MPTKEKLQNISTRINKKYEGFVQSLRLVGLGLKDTSSSIDRKAFFSLDQKSKRAVTTFEHTYRLTRVEAKYFDSEGRFTLAVAESADAKPALRIECTFQVHIHTDAPFPKSFAEKFSNSELRLILVPYARQFVSGITSQMAIPPVVLPLIIRAGS